MNELFPVLVEKKEECCGCSACVNICPRGAIKMLSDEEGFLYPVLAENICVKCLRCISVCFMKKK